MRISDWSSDVCSSDLDLRCSTPRSKVRSARTNVRKTSHIHSGLPIASANRRSMAFEVRPASVERWLRHRERTGCSRERGPAPQLAGIWASDPRSEEHTSELQSLMRISYAVFCLKKKKLSQQALKHH